MNWAAFIFLVFCGLSAIFNGGTEAAKGKSGDALFQFALGILFALAAVQLMFGR